MPIRFSCACGQNLAVLDRLAGKRIRCTGCGAILAVPDEAPEPVKEQEDREAVAATNEVEQAKTCPSCGESLTEKAVLCVACGFDLRLGKKTKTAKVEPPEPKKKKKKQKKARSRPYVGIDPALIRLGIKGLLALGLIGLVIYGGSKLLSSLSVQPGDGGGPLGFLIKKDTPPKQDVENLPDWKTSYENFKAHLFPIKLDPMTGLDYDASFGRITSDEEVSWEAGFSGTKPGGKLYFELPALPAPFKLYYLSALGDIPLWDAVPKGQKARFTGRLGYVIREVEYSNGRIESVSFSLGKGAPPALIPEQRSSPAAVGSPVRFIFILEKIRLDPSVKVTADPTALRMARTLEAVQEAQNAKVEAKKADIPSLIELLRFQQNRSPLIGRMMSPAYFTSIYKTYTGALKLLAERGPEAKAAVPAIRDLLSSRLSDNSEVRAAAEEALKRINIPSKKKPPEK